MKTENPKTVIVCHPAQVEQLENYAWLTDLDVIKTFIRDDSDRADVWFDVFTYINDNPNPYTEAVLLSNDVLPKNTEDRHGIIRFFMRNGLQIITAPSGVLPGHD